MTLSHGYSHAICGNGRLHSELLERERCRAWTRTVRDRSDPYKLCVKGEPLTVLRNV
jgi:hypothetical protein